MKNYLLIFSLCFLLSACSLIQPQYFGDKLSPTTSVDIYYSAHDVKPQYHVMGHMTISNIGQEAVKARFVAYAKTVGADAIIITGNNVDNSGKYASDMVNADALKYDK